MNDKYLKMAVKQAKYSVESGGFPAGAVLVIDGEVISKGTSLGFKLNDPTSHAESAAIRKACKKLKTSDLSGATLYTSLQPCLMCFSSANWAGINKIVYGTRKTNDMVSKQYYEGYTNIESVNEKNNSKIELIFNPVYEEQSLKLISHWEDIS